MQVLVAVALTLSSHAVGLAQGRTDVVSLPNGDRITGEVVRLDRGILEFKTDEAGTVYLEWDKLSTLVAMRQVEVVTTDGSTFLVRWGLRRLVRLRSSGRRRPFRSRCRT